MKTKKLWVIVVVLILVSCAPAVIAIPPTETAIPSSTFTPIPPTLTVVSTPTPENISDAKDFSKWIDDYVHAYGGKVMVNGAEMDTSQLTDEVRKNSGNFTSVKTINGIDYSLLVVNGVPLAIRQNGERWQKVTIKILADWQGIKIGSFFGGNNTTEQDFQNILKIQQQEFNLGPIYQGMDCCVENQKGIYTLDTIRYLVKESENSKMSLLFHPLVWSSEIPNWLRSTESKDVWSNSLKEYIQTVMAETKGTNPIVVVVNEYRNPKDVIYQKLGAEYLEMAFQEVRAVSPSATLIYNDYQNETMEGSRYQLTMDVVKTLSGKSLLDGVGLEMHLSGSTPPSKDDVILAMKSYGLPIYITEFDVNMRDFQGDINTRMTTQAQIYKSIIDACIESQVCKYIIPFQLGDKFSVWENNQKIEGYSKNADPTIYDDDLRPKPAYYAIIQSLYEHVP
jgi:endo-1,4-beta-xylanase